MVPRGLPIGKVEIVNITRDILAGDKQSSQLSSCSGPKLLGTKKTEKEEKQRGGKGEEEKMEGGGQMNTTLKH
jgi:hypothetical protein